MEKNLARIIFHIDMNSFYASVEIAKDPSLKGKPLAVAGKVEDRKGIVVTSSYEARAMGVKTTMTVGEARRHCPELIVKPPDFPLYRQTSAALFDYLRLYTDQVEKVSIDEGYMDVTDLTGEKHPVSLAKEIQHGLWEKLRLPSSIGIAPNKFLAKMASDMKKPMGMTILRKRDIPNILWPLPIGDMHGVGPKTEAKLKQKQINTIGDLATQNKAFLTEWLGVQGEKLYEKANGRDARVVDPDAWQQFKSISQSTTLSQDTTDDVMVKRTLSLLSERLAGKVKTQHVFSYQLSLMIKYYDFQSVTRNMSSKQPLFLHADILREAYSLYEKHWDGRPVRLLGITLSGLKTVEQSSKQLDLFSYEADAKKEPIVKMIDQLNQHYGREVIHMANRNRNNKPKK